MEKQYKKHIYWVSGLATASLLSGCSKPAKQWANAPGTNGFINLDAVKEAFQKNREVEAFERKVNKIYEGDHVVLFGAKQLEKGFELTAHEDLDGGGTVTAGDDLLFTLTVDGRVATLKGAGVNSYYTATWVYTPPEERRTESHYRSHYHRSPRFHYWYWGRGWNNYHTPRAGYTSMKNERDAYRRTSSFHSQVKQNVGFENRMASKYGSGFRKSATTPSSTRKQHISKTMSAGDFKNKTGSTKSTSGWGVRSKMGTASSYSAAKSGSSRSSSGRSSSKGYGGSFRGSSGMRV